MLHIGTLSHHTTNPQFQQKENNDAVHNTGGDALPGGGGGGGAGQRRGGVASERRGAGCAPLPVLVPPGPGGGWRGPGRPLVHTACQVLHRRGWAYAWRLLTCQKARAA